jgi:hypothetical protein
MSQHAPSPLSWLLVLMGIMSFLTQVSFGAQVSLAEVLPEDGEAQGWKKQGKSQHYEGEGLYEYIDGGAEIYHEYGFRSVIVQDFVHSVGKSVSVEVFEMATPESAYGIYTFKTNAKGKKVPIGTDAQLADYYLNFWKGPMLVTLTGFDETEETIKGLLDIAQAIDSRLEATGPRAEIVSRLPEQDLVPQSVKYFKGILGLRNSHPFFDINIFGFEEGVKGDFEDAYSVFIIQFKQSDECLGQYERLKNNYTEDSKFETHEAENVEIFSAADNRERRFYVSAHEASLILVMGDVDRDHAMKIFRDIQDRNPV